VNLLEKVVLRSIQRKIFALFKEERAAAQRPGVIMASPDSPAKSWPDPAKIPGGNEVPFSIRNIFVVGPSLISCVRQSKISLKTLAKNPRQAKTGISSDELRAFEKAAEAHGIGAVGYTKLPRELIFRERGILFDSAVVLVMEMDADAIARAPSLTTFKMVMSTYDRLGIVTNTLAQGLRSMGFQVQASHPLGGLVLYPPLAMKAGLGWGGRHGLLITPQFGPRQRLAALFVNIDNLPVPETNKHSWIKDFCTACGQCMRSCPSHAIRREPEVHASGRESHIEREKCLPVFVKQEGCTVCVKACSFTQSGYEKLHALYLKRQQVRWP
jgi:epoxyqueuosine reductase QueG